MNISCRYHLGKDKRGDHFPQHPLGEVQENINCWAKRILLGPNEISWRLHSHNVVCAHMCVNFEESEYIKGQLDYSDIDTAKTKTIHRSSKAVVPAARIEKERIYEWCALMFSKEVPNRVFIVLDGYDSMKQLKVKLRISSQKPTADELENCINGIFNNAEDGEEVSEVDDGEIIELIHDD